MSAAEAAPAARAPRVIGTAGHVDHGKSTLIKALTGIDPDRLREEQERGMTIDLGFAWLRLPNGQEVSVVDVPGHERFIHNMLAGVGGIDIALLVIAADEGIMPQTREHLAILDLLGIREGVVALTKADLVDREWLDLVQAEVEEELRDTSLAGAPIVAVSALTGQGFEELLALLESMLAAERSHGGSGIARLPIDRVFSVAGFGTVVAGTLVDGELRVGQEIEVQPSGLRARIRGLQSHKRKVDSVAAGTRVAVNLSGVPTEQLGRGQVLSSAGALRPTQVLDARLRLVKDLPRAVGHNMLVTFHSGTAESGGKLGLLDARELEQGQSGWVQIRLAQPLALARGDLFILRQPSPSLTLGGGSVVEPHPKRHRRFQAAVLQRLDVLEQGSPQEILLQHLRAGEPVELEALARRAGATAADIRPTLAALLARGEALTLGAADLTLGPRSLLASSSGWTRLREQVQEILGAFHRANPLRRGLQKEELRGRLGLEPRPFTRVLAALLASGDIAEDGPLVRLANHEVRLNQQQQLAAEHLLAQLEQAGASPPIRAELETQPGSSAELIQALLERGDLVEIAADLVLTVPTYQRLKDTVVAAIRERGHLTVSEARDLLATSRRYVLPLLGHLDDQRVTRRQGDERVLF